MISTPLDSELLVILPRFVAEMMDGGGGGGELVGERNTGRPREQRDRVSNSYSQTIRKDKIF